MVLRNINYFHFKLYKNRSDFKLDMQLYMLQCAVYIHDYSLHLRPAPLYLIHIAYEFIILISVKIKEPQPSSRLIMASSVNSNNMDTQIKQLPKCLKTKLDPEPMLCHTVLNFISNNKRLFCVGIFLF